MINTQTLRLDSKLITKGDTFKEVFSFFDEDDNPINLTTYNEIKMDIRSGLSARSELIYSASLGTGEIIISGTNNNILEITIPSSETVVWKRGDYNRDVRFIDDDTVDTLLWGIIKIRENITDLL